MDKLTIRFDHLNLKTIEGQLLLAACRLHTGNAYIEGMEEYLIELQQVHDELCFTKELNEIIGK